MKEEYINMIKYRNKFVYRRFIVSRQRLFIACRCKLRKSYVILHLSDYFGGRSLVIQVVDNLANQGAEAAKSRQRRLQFRPIVFQSYLQYIFESEKKDKTLKYLLLII